MKTITNSELRERIATELLTGTDHIYVLDTRLAIPPFARLTETFAPICVREFQRAPAVADGWDCDDAARQAQVLANRAHAKSGEASGLAFGWTAGTLTEPVNGMPAGPHAFNIVLADETLYAFEPQNGRVTPLVDLGLSYLPSLVVV